MTAAKVSGAVVIGGAVAVTQPEALPYVLGGWSNVAANVYEDAPNGTL